MKNVPNERKLIYAINIFIVASLCLLFSYGSHLNTTTNLNDVFSVTFTYVSVIGNRDILKFMFTLNWAYLRTKSVAIFYLRFIPVNLEILHPLTLSWYFFHKKKLEMHCFKPRRHKVAICMDMDVNININI